MRVALAPFDKLLNTPTWQLSTLPMRPLYRRVTAAEERPFLVKPDSSIASMVSG